ncbi:hypothetical protein QE152_g32258 [Popillia japonica]|uniref:Uncharacterized protein n=1 Tax=Popillia japonica TaxID=7064 RepID=A0AAW1IZE7_POPJA
MDSGDNHLSNADDNDSLEGAGLPEKNIRADETTEFAQGRMNSDIYCMQRMLDMFASENRRRDEMFMALINRLAPQENASEPGKFSIFECKCSTFPCRS